jgi:predicted RNase H-like HicB family nuclease
MMKLTVRMKKDPDTGWFVVQCVELPAAITQGKTEAEAMKNIKDAIELVLEENREHAKKMGGRLTEISI